MRARRPETIKNHARSPENELCCAPAGEETLRAQKPPCLKRRRNAIDETIEKHGEAQRTPGETARAKKTAPPQTPSNNAGTMATVHARLISYLTKLGGGPAPWAPANLAGTAALFGASAVCAGAYTLWGSSGVPGTHKSSLWQEATNAYLKFQGADPISYPEVGKPKF